MGIANTTSTKFKIRTKIACWFLPMFLKNQKPKQTKETETKNFKKLDWRPVLQLLINFTPVNRPCCSSCLSTKPYRSSCWISRPIFTLKHPNSAVEPLSTPGMLYLHSLALAITAGKQSCCIAHTKMKRGKDQVHANISFLSSLDFIFPV